MKQEIATIKVLTPNKGYALKLSIGGNVVHYVICKLYCMPSFCFEVEEIPIDQVPESELNKCIEVQNIIKKWEGSNK